MASGISAAPHFRAPIQAVCDTGGNLMISFVLSNYERDAHYLGKEGRRDHLDRNGRLYVGGRVVRALHSGRHNDEVQLYAFDMLAGDGDDMRQLPLSMRKANLARLLPRRPDGIFVAPFEQGEIGPDLFRQACKFGLEGLVSKRRDRPYRAGRSADWIKVKNRTHPAMERVKEAFA
jgi:ATP dependent DNA ligase domain